VSFFLHFRELEGYEVRCFGIFLYHQNVTDVEICKYIIGILNMKRFLITIYI